MSPRQRQPNRGSPWVRNQPVFLLIFIGCLTLIAGGCATPIGVERADPRTVQRELTRNVLSTGEPSGFSENVLHQRALTELFQEQPEEALAALHNAVISGHGGADEVFALAELCFLHAENTRKPSYYLASAVYAYAFLFPEGADEPPNPFDPRLRIAADLYNRGITEGFAAPDDSEIELHSGIYKLPFGELEVAFDPQALRWADRKLVHFVPAAEFEIWGLQNRYRQPGIGAPLAAGAVPLNPEQGSQDLVAPNVKVPVTAFLRIEDARRRLAKERLHAFLKIYPASQAEEVQIGGRTVPLETEPTAALALQLSQSKIWGWEYKGFLLGEQLGKVPIQLISLEPYRPGRFPVVFVHGTVSSPARWADMLNDLKNDPQVRERFQFWFFFYNTGNPVPYSALQLREALQEAVKRLDPQGTDLALHQMVIIGHSQGGLLAKMTAIDTGTRLWDTVSRKPLDELDLPKETRTLLRQALFLKPLPFVRRLVFIATPHRGSYVAGNRLSQLIARLVRLPGQLTTAVADAITRNPDAFPFPSLGGRIGSVYGMTPGNPLVNSLASIPVAPGFAVHSIIAVKGNGPVAEDNDGVVEYASAHLEDADSELVVRSGHSVQSNPHTIEEVRRILLLHAETACAVDGVCPGTAVSLGKTR